jgi:hypothetical protein
LTLEDKIPAMSVAELENLHANALRISQGAVNKQQAEAARLLPIIAEALERQRAASAVEAAEKRAVRQKDMAAARAKKTAARKAAASEES